MADESKGGNCFQCVVCGAEFPNLQFHCRACSVHTPMTVGNCSQCGRVWFEAMTWRPMQFTVVEERGPCAQCGGPMVEESGRAFCLGCGQVSCAKCSRPNPHAHCRQCQLPLREEGQDCPACYPPRPFLTHNAMEEWKQRTKEEAA